jgi:tensin
MLLYNSDPEFDTMDGTLPKSAAELLEHGVACNVVYIGSYDMETLTGPEAIAKSVEIALSSLVTPTVVHFKVSSQGITLTDNKRK